MKKISNSILYIGNNLKKNTKYNSTLVELSKLLKRENFTVYISSNKKNKILRLLSMCFSVLKYKNKVRYILIDTFSTSNFYFALLTSQIARFFKIKYIPILHGGNLPDRLMRSIKLSELIFKNSYLNIAPSDYLKSEFEKQGYKTVLIPNVITTESYSFRARKNIAPKLLFVRAFAQIYNPKMAIELLVRLKKTHPKALLCMIGPDRDGTLKEVKQLIAKYELTDSIEITGALTKEQWHAKSKAFDIFINTTNIDNTPLSVMEAMALGLPVVSTNVGGIPYLIEHNKDGLLVDKNNVDQMLDAVVSLIDGNHKDIARNARKKVESFSWNNLKDNWLRILN
ncbi:MAG: glycosyltransferase involved in cell wall biosynthesis [Polaribacter sp.]|jgi:glycosyltransferase involved in cell wall biosynthesis